ncbi:MAG: YcgN family cysteine cluster protein [Desulfuromonadaceae bacterium]|nr:YcgN family cysteine cluster protein [Desulfuromonadaceae bacterium]
MPQPGFLKKRNLCLLNEGEWESLCDNCGFCCLYRVLYDDTEEVYLTRVMCSCYDLKAGKCSVYEKRFEVNPDCTRITAENIAGLTWLPPHCAYRLAYENQSLPENRPLFSRKRRRSGQRELERVLGGRVVLYEDGLDLCDYIVWKC